MKAHVKIFNNKDYTDGQKRLIEIWNNKIQSISLTKMDSGRIGFSKPNDGKKTLFGKKIYTMYHQKDGGVYASMATEDFLEIMKLSGIKIDVTI